MRGFQILLLATGSVAILPVQVKYGNDKSTATKNENRCSNSVFQCLTKMKVRIPFFNEGGKRKTENENGSSNSVFPCRRKTVDTKVHAFETLYCLNRIIVKNSHYYHDFIEIESE